MTSSVHLADLNLQPNEASGLLHVADPLLRRRYGWDVALWTVLDEVDVGDCLVLIGHRAGSGPDGDWQSVPLATSRRGDVGRADDAEALARHDGWVYVFGSQHGGKSGPIRRREQWVARFRESDVARRAQPVDLTVVRTRFLLHRLVNDALHDSPLRLLPMGTASREAFITRTRDELDGSADADRVRPDDWTINVEGAEFTPDGTLLLGLRFPVSDDGRPLVVAVGGCDRLFDGGTPEIRDIWAVDAVGRGGALAGVRDLCLHDGTLHVVTGNLDSKGKGSAILQDYPDGRDTVNTHFETTLDPGRDRLPAAALREFPDHPRIEGVAADDGGRFYYVSDEDATIHLRSTPLLAGT